MTYNLTIQVEMADVDNDELPSIETVRAEIGAALNRSLDSEDVDAYIDRVTVEIDSANPITR